MVTGWTGGLLAAAVLAGAVTVRAVANEERSWTVPGTRPYRLRDVQFSGEAVIPCRRVSFRDKYAVMNAWGDLKVHPVVRTPNGRLYRGFVRTHAAGTLADRWISWTFPTQFRAPGTRVHREEDAGYGDSLADHLDRTRAHQLLPASRYEVKWVVNHRLIDAADEFEYAYRELG